MVRLPIDLALANFEVLPAKSTAPISLKQKLIADIHATAVGSLLRFDATGHQKEFLKNQAPWFCWSTCFVPLVVRLTDQIV